MRIMVTGGAGFAGSHLTELLVEDGTNEVMAVDRVEAPPENLVSCQSDIRYEQVDLDEMDSVDGLFASFAPELIYHLAAQAFVPAYEGAWEQAALGGLRTTLHIYEAITRYSPDARLVLVSSAEVYGTVFGEVSCPVDETAPTRPANVYGATKLALEHYASSVHAQKGLDVVILRPFNHIGPRQSPSFVCSSFAKQIAEIERGTRPPVIHVGNLDAERDFTDVRDMVKAYKLAAARCEPNDPYNICRGSTVSMRTILDMLIEMSGVEVDVAVDPARQRATDIMRVCGNGERFRQCTGWTPEYTLEKSIEDVFVYWRNRCSG